MKIAGKKFEDIKLVSTGGGAAGIACLTLLMDLGVKRENIWMLDREGLCHEGRNDLDETKRRFAQPAIRAARPQDEVIGDADLFLGVSGPGCPDRRHGCEDGQGSGDHGPGQPDTRDHAARGDRRAAGCHHLHRAVRLSEPDQQRALLPVHLPGCAGRRRDADQRADEGGLCPRAGGAGAAAHPRPKPLRPIRASAWCSGATT